MDVKTDMRRDDLHRLLLLLVAEPKAGFEEVFNELVHSQVDRLLQPADSQDGDRD